MADMKTSVLKGYLNEGAFEGDDIRPRIHPTFSELSPVPPPATPPPVLGVATITQYEEGLFTKEREQGPKAGPGNFKVYKRRYYVLLLYSMVVFFQCMIWNTWGPISASALEAFPHWTDATVATLANWGPISFILFVVPTSWAVFRWGMRPVTVTFTFCVALGHGLRCITTQETAFTVFAHLCGLLNGIEGTLLLAGAMVPAVWFPAEQRITATAFSSVLNMMGSGGSFLQPLLVRAPGNDTTPEEIRGDIRTLMFIEMGIAVALFLAVLAYFPSSPPTPPSPSSQVERYNFSDGYREIMRNRRFWQFVIPDAVFTGVSMVWLGVMNFSLEELGVNQDEAVWLGFYASIATGVVGLIVSRLADIFYGHLKKTLFFMMSVSSICYIWFMLLTLDVITSTKAQVYITVLGGQSFNVACAPIFFELCVETVYPSSENAVGTIATLSNNIVGALFLFIFYIPGISDNGNKWMTYALVASNLISILPTMLNKIEYKRSKLDRKELAE